MNEEEIRGKLLLPYLNDLGFEPSEISLEKSFKIRLGKSLHLIKGRSDILCKRNGKNLFVIELKAESVAISQSDIDQGISYARALEDEIAPFTVITNGKATKIFDTISKLELTGSRISESSDFWKNGLTLSTDEELRIRYEALKKFVSFSGENLRLFCQRQVEDRMGPIVGSIDAPAAKFIRELHMQRQDLQGKFSKFTSSKASVFGIVGAAGVGKTNTVCSLALESLDHAFVFFYNAALINKSPLDHIAQDLNLVFSAKSDSSLVLKKLDEMGRFLNKNVLLFIDAIDEHVSTNIALELSEIALSIRALDRVKLCISCKSNIWGSLLNINSTRTYLFEELDKFHDRMADLDNMPGYLLLDFNSEELSALIPPYKNAFGFKGEISEKLLKELKNGFFLRIFSEVYAHRQVPEKIDDKNLISSYLRQSLEKTADGYQQGLRILAKIGSVLVQHQFSERDRFYENDGLETEDLLENLNFTLNETLPEDLFTRNILIRSAKENTNEISFYYSKIRDYIICFHSYRLDKLDDKQFYALIAGFYKNYIGRSAMEFYIANASQAHQQVFIRFKKDKALAYAEGYNTYLEENLKKSKKLFIPRTEGEIGIALPVEILEDGGYALFPIRSKGDPKIAYEKLRDIISGPYFEGRLAELGIDTVYGSHSSLLVPDQSTEIKKKIFSQLKNIIEKGRLSCYSSDVLLFEQLALIVYYYSRKLGYSLTPEDFYLPRFEQIYPLDLKDIQNKISRYRTTHYYRQNQNDYLPSEIAQLIEAAVQQNLEIPKMENYGDFPPFEELSRIIDILMARGYEQIEKHYLSYPDRALQEIRAYYTANNMHNLQEVRDMQYSPTQAELYIRSFFSHLESCYKDFVEELFPTFKDGFKFYNSMPHEYFFYIKKSDFLTAGYYGYRSSNSGQTEFHFREYIDMDDAFKEGKVSRFSGFRMDKILHSNYHHPIKTIDKFNTREVDDFCVMRNWVYQLLKNDIRAILRENGEPI